MRINIVGKSDAPAPPYTQEVTDFNIPVVPYALGALWLRSQKYWWQDDTAWQNGRNLCNQLAVSLLMPSGQAIVNAIDRVGNLLDAAIFYHNRSVVSGAGTAIDPYVYDPPIETAWDGGNSYIVDIDFQMNNLFLGLQNLLNGTLSGDYPDARNFRDQLEAIQTAVEGAATAERWDDMLAALGGLADLLIAIGAAL